MNWATPIRCKQKPQRGVRGCVSNVNFDMPYGMAVKMRRKNRDQERTVSREEFVIKLRRLAEALEAGKAFVIQVAGERIRIPRDAEISIEHEREGAREELEFQLKWQRD